MKKEVVRIIPELKRLMDYPGIRSLSPQEAIGELVANCFDARFNEEKLNISIDLRDDCIVVIDNGKGMTSKILEKAVCFSEDVSKHNEIGVGAKIHFGMGFKTACASLGYFYEIYTRPASENVEFHVEFDLVEFSQSNSWEAIIEDSKPSETSPLKRTTHGTAFVIRKLNMSDFPTNAVLEYLGDTFKLHIENGDKISVIDDNGNYFAKPRC